MPINVTMKTCLHCAEPIQLKDAGVVCKNCGRRIDDGQRGSRRGRWTPARVVTFLVVTLFALGLLAKQSSRRELAAAAGVPITIVDAVENVPADSWKAVALNVPYGGNLSVTLEVVNGNPLDIFLVPGAELDAVRAERWTSFRAYRDFNATKTKLMKRSQAMSAGLYYLVMRDTSLGILSQTASDVSLNVRLTP